ncbi:MAG TPA: hypothetical protein VGI92_03295 [Gemmatimonadales bacterium]|jgi:hypothetical protein
MLKPLATVAAAGFVGLIVTKLLWLLLLPVIGMFIGFLVLMLKIALVVGLVWFGFSLFRKWTDRPSEA